MGVSGWVTAWWGLLAVSPVSSSAAEFDLEWDGATARLSLYRIVAPVADGYRASRWSSDGASVSIEASLPTCLYDGSVVEGDDASSRPGSFASVTTCLHTAGHADGDTVHGLVSVWGELWSITPLPDRDPTDGIDHAMVPVQAYRIGSERAQLRRVRVARRRGVVSAPPPAPFREGTDLEMRHVEVLAVNDTLRVGQQGGEAAALADTVAAIAAMNTVLASTSLEPRLRMVLSGQIVFAGDPFVPADAGGGEIDDNDLLDEFNTWAQAEPLQAHDLHILMSGYDFEASTIGLAPVGGMCTPGDSGFVVQATPSLDASVPFVGVHEMGHTLNMQHDGSNGCPQESFVMTPSLDPNTIQSEFSSCSLADWAEFSGLGAAWCLTDLPADNDTDLCGDGLRSGTEECDCGANDCGGIDPCCDGNTCMLVGGAVCSDFNDLCCVSCQVAVPEDEVVCRPARDACDVAEVCSGADARCPGDTFEASGEACTDGLGNDGWCYAGSCVSRDSACEAAGLRFGGGFVAPTGGCFSIAGCGDLICGSESDPMACFNLQAVTPDGAECAASSQCVDGACLPASGLDDCPADPDKDAPGVCGCGVPDRDGDGDTTLDCVDGCPDDPDRTAPPCGSGSTGGGNTGVGDGSGSGGSEEPADGESGSTGTSAGGDGPDTTGTSGASEDPSTGEDVEGNEDGPEVPTPRGEVPQGLELDGCNCRVPGSGGRERFGSAALGLLGLLGLRGRRRRPGHDPA